jgi:hypothetical protein
MTRIKQYALLLSLLWLAPNAVAQWNALNPAKGIERQSDGVLFTMQTGLLRLEVCSDSIVRVLYTPTSSFPDVKHLAVIKTSWPQADFSVESTDQEVTLSTAQLRVSVARQDVENCTVRAPFAGVVVSKDAQIGEMVSPISAGGGFTRTGIAPIVDMASLEIEVDVNESYIARVKPGQKVEAILEARDRSKGGTISEGDLGRVKSLASLAIQLSSLRDGLNGYVESQMKRVSPNVAEVAGATIGARLMAKAGGLDRLAVMPASTIQILGAEKALFRSLRTGAKPPKHGILFQHQAVHTAPKWQRGKIARTLANKIAIAARVDFYRGSEDPTIKASLDKRLESIKERYKEPPVRRLETRERPRRDERPQRRNKFRRK